MNILLHSNVPWTGTGYGQQTALLAHRLRAAGHNVAISATWGLQGGQIIWNDFTVYPSDEKWGKRLLRACAADHAGGDPRDCLVIPIMDVWVLNGGRLDDLTIAPWCPVDHDPIPPRVLEFLLNDNVTPIAMSRFGETRMQQAGLEPLYVPHAIDTTVFAPAPDRDALREEMGIPAGAFVVGMVAANIGTHPPRKAFPQVFQAFAAFQRAHPDALLYLHTEMHGANNGINLMALADICQVPRDAVRFQDQLNLELGIHPATVAEFYNAMDVLANPSYGEGFGIPIVEAQACGTPVIVTEWTAMPELCGAGWRVGGEPWYDAGHGAFYRCPSVAGIYEALTDAHRDAAGMREKARAFAAGYDADLVFETHWQPALDQLAGKVGGVREVAALA